MDLKNGYKVIYEKTADGKRAFYASKTGVFADAELIAEATIGEYKLIYEKNGNFYGSATGIPANDDHCFEDLKAVFVEGYSKAANAAVESEAPIANPVVEDEPEDEISEADPEDEIESEE